MSETRTSPGELGLRTYLARRLAPLAVLVVIVVSSAAPLAYYGLGVRALAVRADSVAHQIAEVLAREVQQRPALWRYDSLKLLTHLRTYQAQEDIVRIEVVDEDGMAIDLGAAPERAADARLIWRDAPVAAAGRSEGQVWVAASSHRVRRDSLLLALVFGVLGLGLAGIMYGLPVRAMAEAEAAVRDLVRRLQASQDELSRINASLEDEVQLRSSELASAYDELKTKEQRLRELSSRAVSMQEAERRAVARDLHDSAGQALTAIRIHLQLIAREVADHGVDTGIAQLLQRTTTAVDDALEDIRRAVARLGPAILDDVGLREAIVRMCDDLQDQHGIVARPALPVDDVGLPAAIETTCYRVVQEALTNVVRHADATHVDVRIAVHPEHAAATGVVIEVEDDGRGLDHASPGRGLRGMRERVELLGGAFSAQGEPGRGTKVRAVIPWSGRQAKLAELGDQTPGDAS